MSNSRHTNDQDQPFRFSLRSETLHSMNDRACEIAVEYRTDKNNMEEQAYEQQPLNRIIGAIFCGWGHEPVMTVEKNLLILHKLCAHDSRILKRVAIPPQCPSEGSRTTTTVSAIPGLILVLSL